MAGYLKIPRDLFNSDEWKERRVFGKIEAQVDLLQMAAYVDGRVVHCATRDVVLQRGQLLTTMRFLETTSEYRLKRLSKQAGRL